MFCWPLLWHCIVMQCTCLSSADEAWDAFMSCGYFVSYFPFLLQYWGCVCHNKHYGHLQSGCVCLFTKSHLCYSVVWLYLLTVFTSPLMAQYCCLPDTVQVKLFTFLCYVCGNVLLSSQQSTAFPTCTNESGRQCCYCLTFLVPWSTLVCLHTF